MSENDVSFKGSLFFYDKNNKNYFHLNISNYILLSQINIMLYITNYETQTNIK
jgi:hypothetical protein